MPTFNFNNTNPRNLTPDQQRLINMYINQYNQTNAHIDLLLDMLDEIRGNILNIINVSQPRRSRINRHTRNSNSNINRVINQIFNDRQNSFVYYDFQNPINPNLYHDFNYNTASSNIWRNRNNNFSDMAFNTTNRNEQDGIIDDYTRNILETFLNSSVSIRPTAEQIQNASRIIRFGDIEHPLTESCPISLDEFNDDDQVRQLLPCGHIFHENQFNEWFQSNVRCPVCRYDIRNFRPLSRRNTPTNISTSPNPNNSSAQSNTTNTTNTTNTENINNQNNTNNTTNSSNTNNTNNESNTPTSTNSESSFSNFHVTRDPISNQVEHLTFDITDQQVTNSFLDRIARNLFQSMLNPHTQNNTDRFMIDPSNNILFYETIIRPNTPNN